MQQPRSRVNPVLVWVLGVLLGGLALQAGFPAGASALDYGENTGPVSKDLTVNGQYLRDAMALGQSALDRLRSAGAADELPAIHATIDRMYRTVRTAKWGMEERQKSLRFPDPLLDYEIKKTSKAWNTIRKPTDHYFDSPPPDVYIQNAIRDLTEAMAELRPVVAVLP